MKYWNKRRQFRDAGWYMVILSDPMYKWNDLKVWCQQQPSRCRFYSSPWTPNVWYFELESDASWFTLKWL
mgnify:FL=1